MQAMHLVTPEGKIFRGVEAAVHAVATRPILGKVAYLYYLPGLRGICDRLYAWIAAHRYQLAGDCPSGTCSLHVPARQKTMRDVQNTEDRKLS
jgi:predicted DCC family thiol-disulfide oxidoreductase YuxK